MHVIPFLSCSSVSNAHFQVCSFADTNTKLVCFAVPLLEEASFSSVAYFWFVSCVCVYVQTDSVAGQVASVDDSSATNLWKLVATAKQVLDQPVSERNFQTGKLASISNGGNNRDALFRYINSPKPVPVPANFMLSCVCSFQQLNKLLSSVELLK